MRSKSRGPFIVILRLKSLIFLNIFTNKKLFYKKIRWLSHEMG